MTEDAKPRLPKKPAARKPAKKVPYRPQNESELARVQAAEALLSVDERACAHLSCEFSKEHACKVLNWSMAAVDEVLRRPAVRHYLQKADDYLLIELAKAKVRRMRKVGISQANVEERLMEIAQMGPEDTKGTVDGQVKALRTLAEILGMIGKGDEGIKNKSREELMGYITKVASGMTPAQTVTEPSLQ